MNCWNKMETLHWPSDGSLGRIPPEDESTSHKQKLVHIMFFLYSFMCQATMEIRKGPKGTLRDFMRFAVCHQ